MTPSATTRVSMSEILRVAPWALRALGYPFGVAERAARLLAWTEAATGEGLVLLRDGVAQRRPTVPLHRQGGNGAERRIEAAGRSLFEVGPSAIDLVTADLRLRGAASLALTDATDLALIPSLTDIAARRRLNLVILRRAGWAAVTIIADGVCFLRGDLDDLDLLPLSTEARDAIDRHARAAQNGAEGYLGFVGFNAPPPFDQSDRARIMDYRARLDQAYREGLDVATLNLHHLYALERITWAPTSERSRGQAGY